MTEISQVWNYIVRAAPDSLPVLMFFFTALIIAQAVPRFFERLGILSPIPISHKIAFIGLPGAGKTTLITAVFELIQCGVHLPAVRLHGYKTIKRVNQYVAKLSAGELIGPTRETDTFMYRFSYIKHKLISRLSYDVEIADFPGQYTERIEGSGVTTGMDIGDDENVEFDEALFDKEFFSWIASAREYLFVIDLASIYSDKNVRKAIADITGRMRTSWQVIEDAASDRGIGDPRRRRVHVVFTKMDSLLPVVHAKFTLLALCDVPISDAPDSVQNELEIIKSDIAHAGIRFDIWRGGNNEIPDLAQLKAENKLLFRDLLDFFQARVNLETCIYTSVGLRGTDGERMGIVEALRAVLP